MCRAGDTAALVPVCMPGQCTEGHCCPLLSSAVNSVLNARDFRAVDHRLKLYLDMEVFEENAEEFQCFLKVSSHSTTPTTLWLSLLPPCKICTEVASQRLWDVKGAEVSLRLAFLWMSCQGAGQAMTHPLCALGGHGEVWPARRVPLNPGCF